MHNGQKSLSVVAALAMAFMLGSVDAAGFALANRPAFQGQHNRHGGQGYRYGYSPSQRSNKAFALLVETPDARHILDGEKYARAERRIEFQSLSRKQKRSLARERRREAAMNRINAQVAA